MRSSIVFAGLAAVVAADVYTSTVTEDVTITSCAPTVTNCPYKKTSTTTDGFAWGEWDTTTTTSTTSAKKSDPTSSSDEDWSEWSDPSKSTTTSKKVVVSVTSSTTDSWVWGEWSSASTSTTTGKKSDPTASTDEWDEWNSATTSATTSTPAKKTSTTSAVTSGTAACPTYTATAPPDWFSLLPTSVLSSIAAKWTGGPPADWCYYTYSTGSLTTSTKGAATVSSSPYWPTGASTTSAVGTGASTTSAAGTGVKGSSTVTGSIGKWTGAANSNAGSMALAGLAAAAAMVLA